MFPQAKVQHLPKYASDHNPIFLDNNPYIYGTVHKTRTKKVDQIWLKEDQNNKILKIFVPMNLFIFGV
jgi:hypothetical protein